VKEHLLAQGELDAVGGKDYIGEIIDATPTRPTCSTTRRSSGTSPIGAG
jgi:hypothetical protein